MSDIAILKEMFKSTATVTLQDDGYGKKILILEEPDLPNCFVTIRGMPDEDQFIVITAVFMYLYHILLVIFLSSFAPLRLCVRLKNVVNLPENRCKADKFPAPEAVFNGSKGECKRADFIIVADTDSKKVILCIEMKAKVTTTPEWKIIQQLKGAKCFVEYFRRIGKEFWGQTKFLDSYVYRFVTIRDINIAKRTTKEKIIDNHHIPERMLKISNPQYLQFNHLIGLKK